MPWLLNLRLSVVSELQVSVDIAVAFVVLVLVSVVVAEADSSERPRFLAFPNVDCFANSSSSVELVGEESVHSPTGARTNFGLCSILSNPGLHQNKNLEHYYNNPNPGYNNASDTNDLPIDATTNHSRKTNPHQCQEQRKHIVSGSTINSGGAANTMGGGKPILTLTLTCAMAGTETTIINAKSIVPKSNFFISLPPCRRDAAWVSSS